MKRFAFCTFIIAGSALQALFAQQQAAPINRVPDDDGGVVQVVPVDAPATATVKPNAAPAMKSVRQVSVFLGSSWAGQAARGREQTLADLSGGLGQLQASNVSVLPAAPSVEDFTDLSRTVINDLAIQRKLVEMLGNRALPAPDPATVYVVFLGAGVKSSVGGQVGGLNYAAYHATVHVESGEVRYVVVPFSENAERQLAAASRAVTETAFDSGN